MKALIYLSSALSLAAPSLAIVGGTTASPSDYPFIVSVHLSEDKSFLCTGSLISKNRVLTSADCIYQYNASQLSIQTTVPLKDGKTHFFEASKKGQFTTYDPSTEDGDLGAIELKAPVDGIEPVKLVSKFPTSSSKATVVGLGAQSRNENATGKDLRSLEVTLFRKEECKKRYPNEVFTSLMDCAVPASSDQGACTGDTGSPVLSPEGLVGLMTRRVSCGDTDIAPDVVTPLGRRGERLLNGRLPS